MEASLGKLTKIDNLHKVWPHEALDFTKWLAEEENISLLSEELGFDIVVDETEASAGRYNVDIRAHSEDDDKTIIIENQLEMTNHDHLGKLIVYASGLDAEVQIWVVKDARDEHKQAVDWLNEHSDEHVNIFLVKIELWKIDDSRIAPKFQILSSPNNWTKTMRKSVSKNLSDAGKAHLRLWEDFNAYCSGKVSFSLRQPSPNHWYDINLGTSKCHVALTYKTTQHAVACELYIPNDQDLYCKLEQHKDEINTAISKQLKWMLLEGKQASRIKLVSKIDVDPEAEDWNGALEWMKDTAELFVKVFGKYIKKIK